MIKNVIVPIVIFSIIVIGSMGIVYGLSITLSNGIDAKNKTTDQLEKQGYTIVTGVINSPTVLQITDNWIFFINHIPLNIPIYYIGYSETLHNGQAGTFVAILNDSYGLAYQPQYKTQMWWI